MAQAVKCNRCGDFVVNPHDRMHSMLQPEGNRRLPDGWMRALFTEFTDDSGIMAKQSEHDMCPNCMESFHEWLLGKN